MLKKFGVALAGLLVGAASAVPVLAMATTAGADPTPLTPSGSIEICKVASSTSALPVPTTIPFSFTYTNGTSSGASATVSVGVGTCTGALTIYGATSSTITEAIPSPVWYQVTAITALNQPGTYLLPATSVKTQTAVVSVNSSTTSAVQFTNAIVTGYVEVCKVTSVGDNLTGSFGFAISGVQDTAFSTSTTVSVGNCSDPILVPAGSVKVVEQGTNLYVTKIIATNAGGNTNALVGTPNLVTGTSVVAVNAGSMSLGSTVTYTNDTVTVKVCKEAFPNEPTGVTTFPFTFAPTAPGSATAVGSTSVAAGNCAILGQYAPGTQVTITEGITPGTKASAIVQDPSSTGLSWAPVTAPAVNPDVINGKATIIVGTPVNSPSTVTAPDNEAIVDYTNVVAMPGEVKICKFAGSMAPNGTVFNFSVTGVSGTTAVTLGQCELVGGASNPVLFPYGSSITVTEAASAGNAVSAISVAPATLTQTGGATTTSSIVSSSFTPSVPNSGGAVTLLVSEAQETLVNFTNIDPPLPSPGQTTTVTGGGSTTVGATPTIASSASTGTGVLLTTSAGSTAAVNTSSGTLVVPASVATSQTQTTVTLTKAQKAALLKKDNRSLSNVKAAISKWQTTLKHTTSKLLRKTINNRLSTLRSEEKVLQLEIALLK